MEDDWFVILRDTLSIAGNFAECIGAVFLFSQFRRPVRQPVKRQQIPQYDQQFERQ